jgi:hypothetical protein
MLEMDRSASVVRPRYKAIDPTDVASHEAIRQYLAIINTS